MPEHLFYFLFCASEAQIFKSSSAANAAPTDTLAVPGGDQTPFKIQKNSRGETHMGGVEHSYDYSNVSSEFTPPVLI